MTCDVVIAGGGPAGSTLALLLGRAGLAVKLFEARRLPLDKPCGEGIMPAGVAVLDRVGLTAAVGGRPIAGVRYQGFGRTVEASFASAGVRPGLAQRRRVLDAVLWKAASETSGVQAEDHTAIEEVSVREGRVEGVRIHGRLQPCRLLVAADGASSSLRRLLGLEGRSRLARTGVRAHFASAPQEATTPGWVEIFMGEGRELYVTPLPEDQLSVAALAAPEMFRARGTRHAGWVAQEPLLAARLRDGGAHPVDRWAGRTSLGHVARAGWCPGAVLLGDAAFSLDPLTANGVSQALVSAEMLAQRPEVFSREASVADAALAAFDRQRWREARGRVRLSRALLGAVATASRARLTLTFMRRSGWLVRALLRVAAGTV